MIIVAHAFANVFMTIVFRFIWIKVESRFSAISSVIYTSCTLHTRTAVSVRCCCTCRGISPGHRRLDGEQIEVLVYTYHCYYYIITLYYAMGRLRVVVATEWTLVSSPPINNSCMCAHVHARRGQLPVSLTQTIVQSARLLRT